MAKKVELNEIRQVKDSVQDDHVSTNQGTLRSIGKDTQSFIEYMVKQHPNYYSLGQAIHRYHLENLKSK